MKGGKQKLVVDHSTGKILIINYFTFRLERVILKSRGKAVYLVLK